MPPDWTMGEPDPAAPLVPDPFDPSGFGHVLSGGRGEVTWDLYDGPHPLPAHPEALGSRFTFGTGHGHSGSDGVGAPVRLDQLALIGSTASGAPGEYRGFLEARCHPMVRSAVLHTATGATEAAKAVTSAQTGEGWVVWFFDVDDPAPTRVDLLGADDAVVASRSVVDPRTHLRTSRRGRR